MQILPKSNSPHGDSRNVYTINLSFKILIYFILEKQYLCASSQGKDIYSEIFWQMSYAVA